MQTTSGNEKWDEEIGKMDDDGYLFYYVQEATVLLLQLQKLC